MLMRSGTQMVADIGYSLDGEMAVGPALHAMFSFQPLVFLKAEPLWAAMWSDLSLLISYCGSSLLA